MMVWSSEAIIVSLAYSVTFFKLVHLFHTGPIYHGIDAHNQYQPMEHERVSGSSEMFGPKYTG